MELFETQEVLDAIAGYDGRTWTDSALDAWHVILERWPLADAMQAVHEHYAAHEKRIMPVNIRARCVQLRDVREAAERRALEAPSAPVVTEVGREARRQIAAVVGRVTARTDAAYRSMPPADPTSPTSPDSDITEAARREQMARLRAMALA